MQEQIKSYLTEVENFSPSSKDELEQFRIRFLGKKGVMGDLFAHMKNVEADQRKAFGALVNELKQHAEEKIAAYKDSFENKSTASTDIDLTLPGEQISLGSLHPISIVRNRIVQIFERIGFNVTDGPEIEDDWHNFSALNFPPEHPARDMQDTFFVKGSDLTPNSSPKERGVASEQGFALRTHTSSVQVRLMETQAPPIRSIMPGRVYRNEAISARAHCFFHQVEGLYIDEDVSFADLKQTLLYFAKEMFGEKTEIRLRPSYFPFTEPSAEVDVSCTLCGGKGCNVCKYTGWLEILGCGMVDPQVLINCGIDEKKYTGFAFGMGIERIAMLQYDINDLRIFSENDVRFLRQFSGLG